MDESTSLCFTSGKQPVLELFDRKQAAGIFFYNALKMDLKI